MSAILEPRINFEILPIQQLAGVQTQKVLIIGQMLSGSAIPGELVIDIPNDGSEDDLFGERSHIAAMVRAFKRENKISRLDAIPLQDVSTGEAPYMDIKILDPSSESGNVYISIGSQKDYYYTLPVINTQSTSDIADNLIDLINADSDAPFSAAVGIEPWIIRITLIHIGKIGEDWSLRLYNQLSGLHIDIENFKSGGGVNPVLSGIFDVVGETRYQTIVWPSVYETDELETFLSARFNTDNQILDGIGLQTYIGFLHQLQTHADQNNQSIIIIGDKKINTSTQAKLLCDPAGVISNFQTVSDGSFKITIDGTEEDLTDLDFTLSAGYLSCLTSGPLADFQDVSAGSFKITIDEGTEQDITAVNMIATVASFISSGSPGVLPWTVYDGSFRIFINGVQHDITGIDLHLDTTYAEVAISITNAIYNLSPEGAICTYNTDHFEFRTRFKGSNKTISVLSSAGVGTDISGASYLNAQAGTVTAGTGPNNFSDVSDIIGAAITGASCSYSGDHFTITSDKTGIESHVSVLSAGSSGTDISGIAYMNGLAGISTYGTSISTYEEVAQIINDQLERAYCEYELTYFSFTSYSHGNRSSVSVLSAGSSGTDISGEDHLNGLDGEIIPAQELINDRTGASIPEIPDCITSEIAAIRALRLTENMPLQDYLTTPSLKDQYGGIGTASLPYFNTLLPNIKIPYEQDLWTNQEQIVLKDSGVSIIGADSHFANVIMGEFITTYLRDSLDNPDTSYKYLNTIDTSSHIREFFYQNCRIRYSQTRLIEGDLIPGRDMANAGSIRAFLNELYVALSEVTLVQAGSAGLKDFNQNLIISTDIQNGSVTVNCAPLLITQLRIILGTIKINFGG